MSLFLVLLNSEEISPEVARLKNDLFFPFYDKNPVETYQALQGAKK